MISKVDQLSGIRLTLIGDNVICFVSYSSHPLDEMVNPRSARCFWSYRANKYRMRFVWNPQSYCVGYPYVTWQGRGSSTSSSVQLCEKPWKKLKQRITKPRKTRLQFGLLLKNFPFLTAWGFWEQKQGNRWATDRRPDYIFYRTK